MVKKIDDLQDNMQNILIQAVEKGRDKVIELLRARIRKGRDENNSLFGSYSESHKSRRRKESLQTSYKDFHFSGTMFDHFEEVKRTSTIDSATIDISFTGKPYRRSDQKSHHKKEPRTNADLALLLNEQTGKKIIALTPAEKQKIIDAIREQIKDDIYHITVS